MKSYEMKVTLILTPSEDVGADALETFTKNFASMPAVIKTGDGKEIKIAVSEITKPMPLISN